MKIGLALGSGAARGWAHIGIIQALEEMGIKIDVVAGCSIGAYVGAAYASNKLPEMAQWAESLSEWQVLGLMGVGLRKGGLASGQKVFQALEDNFCEVNFEDLQKPLGVVATDLYSGKEVSFTHGAIGPAVRASCAIPALFPPICCEGRWLVDGAVVNPVPVNLCRQLGADFVFAVNLSADFRPEIQLSFDRDHEKNQEKTNAFFRKSHKFMKNWFGGDKRGQNSEEHQPRAGQAEANLMHDEFSEAELLDPDNLNDEMELGSESEPQPAHFEEPLEKASTASLKPTKRSTPSMLGVMSSSLDILQARVTRSRLAGDPPDVLIEPHLRDFGIMEFHRASELIGEGRGSVKRVAEQIKYQLRMS